MSASELPSRDIGRETVRASVANYIKELIFEGKLAPGDRVPQDEVAGALNVSNTPVREGLIQLEHEGLVTIKLHRGAFVLGFDQDSISRQYELYALLWGWAIRRAVDGATPELVDELLDLAHGIGATKDPAEMYRLMSLFTEQTQEAGGSREWRRLLDTLPRLVPGPSFYTLVPGAMVAASESMGVLARALQARDVDRAVTAVERMMYDHGDALMRELERRGLI
jgi:DNA-binding GntR family transcriptional regulator